MTNRATITNPKDISDEHAAAFTDNSSIIHYSATFQTIEVKGADSKLTSLLATLKSISNLSDWVFEASNYGSQTPCLGAGAHGIHNNLLKLLLEDPLNILNNTWTSFDFPHYWRAATVNPILKWNTDNTDPLNYSSIALTSCLCKVLVRMINTRFIWYLVISGKQTYPCSFRKHRSTNDNQVSLGRYVRNAFTRKQQAVFLFLI